MRQAYRGDRSALERVRIEDDQVGGIAGFVDNEANQPPLAFIRIRVRGYEHESPVSGSR